MKQLKPFVCMLIFAISFSSNAQSPSFTIVSSSPSITCYSPTVDLLAITNHSAPLSYAWAGTSGTGTGSSFQATMPGTYTVIASTLPGASSTQTISIGVNTVIPISTISPTFQTINCTNLAAQAVTLTAISPTLNFTHEVIQPLGSSYSASTPTVAYLPGAGTYTYILRNNANGCFTTKTFTVFTTDGFPTFTLASNQNFTLGCNTKSITTITIPSVVTTPTLGSPVKYAWLPPGSTSNPTFNPGVNTATITTPGTWTVYVKDDGNGCVSAVPMSIIQNTIGPDITHVSSVPVLNCFTPTVFLQATSITPSVTYVWSYMAGSTPVDLLNSSILASTLPSAPTSTIANTYSLTITSLVNACKSTTVVPVYQNIFPPKAIINASGSPSLCVPPSLTLTNGSSSTIPPQFPNPSPVVGFLWAGPNPQQPLSNSNTYTANAPGVYTLTAQDPNNGCNSQTTTVIETCMYVSTPSLQNHATGLSVFPNPGNDHVEISYVLGSSQTASVELINTLGQIIRTVSPSTPRHAGNVKVIADLSDVNAGVYFVRIQAGNEVLHSRLLIQH